MDPNSLEVQSTPKQSAKVLDELINKLKSGATRRPMKKEIENDTSAYQQIKANAQKLSLESLSQLIRIFITSYFNKEFCREQNLLMSNFSGISDHSGPIFIVPSEFSERNIKNLGALLLKICKTNNSFTLYLPLKVNIMSPTHLLCGIFRIENHTIQTNLFYNDAIKKEADTLVTELNKLNVSLHPKRTIKIDDNSIIWSICFLYESFLGSEEFLKALETNKQYINFFSEAIVKYIEQHSCHILSDSANFFKPNKKIKLPQDTINIYDITKVNKLSTDDFSRVIEKVLKIKEDESTSCHFNGEIVKLNAKFIFPPPFIEFRENNYEHLINFLAGIIVNKSKESAYNIFLPILDMVKKHYVGMIVSYDPDQRFELLAFDPHGVSSSLLENFNQTFKNKLQEIFPKSKYISIIDARNWQQDSVSCGWWVLAYLYGFFLTGHKDYLLDLQTQKITLNEFKQIIKSFINAPDNHSQITPNI